MILPPRQPEWSESSDGAPDEPMDDADVAVLLAVRDLYQTIDPPPPGLLDRIRFAVELERLNVRVDQRDDTQPGTPAPKPAPIGAEPPPPSSQTTSRLGLRAIAIGATLLPLAFLGALPGLPVWAVLGCMSTSLLCTYLLATANRLSPRSAAAGVMASWTSAAVAATAAWPVLAALPAALLVTISLIAVAVLVLPPRRFEPVTPATAVPPVRSGYDPRDFDMAVVRSLTRIR